MEAAVFLFAKSTMTFARASGRRRAACAPMEHGLDRGEVGVYTQSANRCSRYSLAFIIGTSVPLESRAAS